MKREPEEPIEELDRDNNPKSQSQRTKVEGEAANQIKDGDKVSDNSSDKNAEPKDSQE